MKKNFLLIAMMLLCVLGASAQRFTDKLNRGLIAMKTTSGVFVSWRIQADEYYDVKYNLYRNGTKIAENLNTSNFTDKSGTTSSTYQVAPVVNGVEKEKCDAVTALAQDYMDVIIKHDPSLKATYVPNDGCCVDVDGDGDVELLLKLDNSQEAWAYYQKEGFYNGTFSEYTLLECIEIIGKDAGKVLWWVNCGPNMGDFQNNEQNIVGYDWDQDGKGEVIMRLCEGAEVHMADGTTYKVGANGQNGTSWTNHRGIKSTGSSATTATIGYNIASGATVSSNADWCTAKIQGGNLVVSVTENTDTGNGRYATITVNENGKTRTFNFGQSKAGQNSVEWFTYYGNEYLYYCEGTTGKPYQCIEFPCKRLEAGETSLDAAWGDGYGHRSNKFFYGAPYLDGRKPSMFIGRGIYTRHKFVALDVDPATHKLTERWRWYNNTNGPWKGQGYHNYAIVDVDWDGRDEIVWGSMVIDDNGKGLSTTGLGHGDAQHHGDLDPYRWGQEGFFCNEDKPTNNYRDLTTSKLYYRVSGSSDAGRAIAGNFSNKTPGSIGFSAHDNAISLVSDGYLSAIESSNMSQNFRCYWDGDLCEETFNYANGKNTEGAIIKYGKGVIKTLTGTMTNNDTKGTPTYMGDILGDWREEFIMRTSSNNLRIHSTTIETPWRNYSLWYDKQYRNGMVWEPCGYNQPPHASYFIGELEGITAAPPAETMTGRTEVANNGTIANSGESVITCETNDMTVAVADGATPYIYIDNAPSWVQGWAGSESSAANDPSKIKYTYYTHTLTGGAFAGDMRLVKQGEGTLVLPNVTQTYKGDTEVWGGALNFDGTLQNSHLWLNRHTALNSDGGNFAKGIKADYNSVIRPGGVAPKASSITTDNLELGFGAIVELDVYSDGTADQLNVGMLNVEKMVWPNGGGPAYDTPVFRINQHAAAGEQLIPDGDYVLATITGKVEGDVADIVVEGMPKQKASLSVKEGKLVLTVQSYEAAELEWTGNEGKVFELDGIANFKDKATGEAAKFTTGSTVEFPATAANYEVTVSSANGNIAPKAIKFNNASKAYTITGDGFDEATITKDGVGAVYLNNVNTVGNTVINGGAIYVSSLANSVGNDYGSLGDKTKTITLDGGRIAANSSVTSDQIIIVGANNGGIYVGSGATFTQSAAIQGANTELTKTGAGTLTMPSSFSPAKLIIQAGTVNGCESKGPANVEFRGGTYSDSNSEGMPGSTLSSNFVVPEDQIGTLILDPRCDYTGKLTGAGTFTVVAAGVRNYLKGNWSGFEGELVVDAKKRGSYDPSFDWDNTYGLPYATLNVPTGKTFNTNGKTVAVKTLKSSATGTISGSGSVILGENHTSNISITNYISCPLTYRGQEGCELRVTATTAGRMSNTVTVESGALRFSGSTSNTTACNGNKILYVKNSGKVYGSNALFYAVQASNGGTFSVTGTNDAPTTVTTMENAINIINANSVLDFKLKSATSYSKLNAKGTLRFASGGILRVRLDAGYTPAIGDSFTLWTANAVTGVNETNVVLDLPTLPSGSKWDTSELYAKTGVLKVVKDEELSIQNLPAGSVVSGDVYTLDGIHVGKITATKETLQRKVKALVGARGNYIVRFTSGTTSESITVNVRR